TVEADLRLRDAIEAIPEAFVVWDAQNRLVICNSNFQELHDLPDPAIETGASYNDVVAAGRKPMVRSKVTSEGQVPGARTFEAQLDDGRWLHISARRTKDGGYVSAGPDIHQSGQYLLDVINDILDMSKIEAGRIRLDLSDIRIGRFLNDAMRVVSARADDKKLTLTPDIPHGIRLTADNRLLKQIVLNLLS